MKALKLFLIFTLICGVFYTTAVTGIAQLVFPAQANGSILTENGKKVGSAHLGQPYTDDAHMWGRVMNRDAASFTGADGKPLLYAWPSNLSPASAEYEELIAERVEKIRAAHPEMGETPVPVELVTCSGSSLDPDISVAAARYQVKRLAKNNAMTEDQVNAILEKCISGRLLGVLGEETVNVLKVNLMLDGAVH